jgi:Mg2+/Co2+ transporter CorC
MLRKQSAGYDNEEFLRPHEERSGEIIMDFLTKQGANPELISKVYRLISKHEEGGDEEQNILRDADSVSFFEIYPVRMMEKITEVGKQKVRDKFNFMYNRIGSEEVKEIVKPLYEKAIKDLEAR